MGEYNEKKETCGTICLKYLLFTFNFFFWLAGGAVMAVGVWTIVEKSDYISLLSSSTYAATAYILVIAGVIVMITGILGCCATFKEKRNLLRALAAFFKEKRLVDVWDGEQIGAEHLFYARELYLYKNWVLSSSAVECGSTAMNKISKNTLDNLSTSLQYFVLLLCIFLLEILAGVLAYIYYQQLNTELKQNLKDTMTMKYKQLEEEKVTHAVDKLQQEFKCCGSANFSDWASSTWIKSGAAEGREVPDSCCKTVTPQCGRRSHPSNIYRTEGGCITKLENFIQDHLRIIGAVGLGIAFVQLFGMIFTCCLYKSLKPEPY